MNVHVPQSLESQAELKYLSAVQFNMISPQSSKPNMCVVQDSLLGSYQMTKGTKKLSKSQFFNMALKLPQAPWSKYEKTSDGMMGTGEIMNGIQHIRKVLKELGKKVQSFNGMGIISLFLPRNFIYNKKNDKNPNEPNVKIWKGVMYEGTIDKNIIGATHNSIQHLIHKEYNSQSAAHFLNCIQFVANEFLLIQGFTIGLGDCLIPKTITDGATKEEEIADIVKKCYLEAEGVKQTTMHKGIREVRINASLSKAKDIGLRIAKRGTGRIK